MAASKRYRLVAIVGSETIVSAWRNDYETVRKELEAVQHAQATDEPIRLDWLGVGSGAAVTAVFIREGAAPQAPRSSPRRSLTSDLYDRDF